MPAEAIPRIRVDIRLPADPFAAQLDLIATGIGTPENRVNAARHILADALETREILGVPPNAFLHSLAHRWATVLREERAHLSETFDATELTQMCALLNGTLLDPWDTGSLYREARDAGLPRGLLSKLRGLSPGAELALVLACERYWRLPREERPELRKLSELLEYV